MAVRISSPTRIEAPGHPPKTILEYIGCVNSGDSAVSVAHMISPSGWMEPGQRPEFDEFTLVLQGELRVETESEVLDIPAGQAVVVRSGEWVRYSSPAPEGAQYIAVCVPAFHPDTVHRDE